jgi:hypothetical protein
MSNPKDCLREEIAQQIKNKFPDAKERKKLKIKLSGSKAELTKIIEEQKVPLLCVPKAMRPKRPKRTPANAIILYEKNDEGENKSVRFNKIKPDDFKPFDMETDCMIRGMKTLMGHQRKFSESFFNSNYHGALAIHGVGSGKTLSAVVISNCYLDLYPNKKVVFIAPSALLANFQKELYYFYSKSIFKADELPYNPLTDPRYSFFSYEKYTRSPVDCVDGLMIVDECHNMRSRMNVEETTMYDADGKEVKVQASKSNIRGFKILQHCAKRADKVLLLTGTPLINTPSDIENMMAFIDGRDPEYDNVVYRNELLQSIKRQKEIKPDDEKKDEKKDEKNKKIEEELEKLNNDKKEYEDELKNYREKIAKAKTEKSKALYLSGIDKINELITLINQQIEEKKKKLTITVKTVKKPKLQFVKKKVNILQSEVFKKYVDYFGYKISFFIPSEQWKKDNFPRRRDNYVFFNLNTEQEKKYAEAKKNLSGYFGYNPEEEDDEEKEGAGLSGGAGDKDPLESFFTGERRLANVMDMSLKIDWIVNLVKSSKTDKSLIYSNYLETGAKAITDELKSKGFKEGKDYAFINSTINRSDRDKFQNAYNNDELRLIFLSRAGAEGLSFLKTKNVILLEPNWNQSIVEQIVARGIRAGSHKMVDEKDRYVNAYYLNMGVEEASRTAVMELIWGNKNYIDIGDLNETKDGRLYDVFYDSSTGQSNKIYYTKEQIEDNTKFIFVKNGKQHILTTDDIDNIIDRHKEIEKEGIAPYSVVNYENSQQIYDKNGKLIPSKDIVKKVVPVDLKILELSIYKQSQIDDMMTILDKVPHIEDFVNNDIEDLNKQIKEYEDQAKSEMPYKMKLELRREIYGKLAKQQIKKVEDNIRKFWARVDNEIKKRKDITKELQQLYNFIPTPVSVIDKMIQKSGILTNIGSLNVLEPTAGIGHIVAQLFDKSVGRESKNLNLFIDMCEFLPANRTSLKDIFSDNPNIRLLDEPDFMQLDTSTAYDYIFMNPPFTIKQQNKTLYAVDFITKAYKNLKEGGKLVAILPPFDFKQNKPFSTFKEFIKDKIIHTEDLGDIFKDDKEGALVYTTGIQTVLIILQKPVSSLFGNLQEEKEEGFIDRLAELGKMGIVDYNAGATTSDLLQLYFLEKYKSKCAISSYYDKEKYQKSALYKDKLINGIETDFLTPKNSEFVGKQLQRCIKIGEKTIVIPLGLPKHKNLLIYRPDLKEVYRFEPHGAFTSSNEKATETYNKKIDKFFQSMKKYIGDVKFYSPLEICPRVDGKSVKGFQSMENNWLYKQDKMTQKKLKKIESGGFCQLWSWFFAEMVLLNPNLSIKEVYEKAYNLIGKEPERFRQVIRGFHRNIDIELEKLKNSLITLKGSKLKPQWKDIIKLYTDEIMKKHKVMETMAGFGKDKVIYPYINDGRENMEGSGIFDWVSEKANDAYNYVKQKYEDVKADIKDRGSAVLTRTNYVGPFNRLDDEYIRTHPPIDIIDEGAMKHDLEYSRIAKLRDDGKIGQAEADKLIRDSDIAFLDNIRDNWKVNPWASALGYAGIRNKNLLEDYVGLDKNLFVGQGSPDGYALHAVIFKKPYDLDKAKQEASRIIKSKNKHFFRETDSSYRFRAIPKTKFEKKSFRTKKINKDISLIFGKLK